MLSWIVNRGRIQRVMRSGMKRVGIMMLTLVRAPRGHDCASHGRYIFIYAKIEGRMKGCALGIRSDISWDWRITVDHTGM